MGAFYVLGCAGVPGALAAPLAAPPCLLPVIPALLPAPNCSHCDPGFVDLRRELYPVTGGANCPITTTSENLAARITGVLISRELLDSRAGDPASDRRRAS